MSGFCGLLTSQREAVPLKSIEVEVEVRDHVATVVSTLHYENKEDKPIEAVFVFPLPGDAAVCHFSAKIGQTQIVAEVKEKQQACEEYDDALSSGQQAFLLEESEQSPDIFTLSVGSLPPGESASIRLEYVTELAVQADDGLRFCLPAVLNPRYQPQDHSLSALEMVVHENPSRSKILRPARLAPTTIPHSKSLKSPYFPIPMFNLPLVLMFGLNFSSDGASVQVTSVPASLVPYSLSFSARVSSPRPVCKIESSCSLDPLQYLNTEQTQATVKLAEGHKFNRDVELLIYYKDAHQPTAVVEAGQTSAEPGTLMGDPVVMLSLYPEFPQSVTSSLASCGEFVFLIDRSGSMDCSINNIMHQETRIGSARDTLLLLLKSLPMGCYFNIYSFGSNYEHIFPNSVEYNQKTMAKALKKVEEMDADLGGTEILEPLKHIYSCPIIPNHPRQLFVFTDGEVSNTKEVIDLVKQNSGSHRCFSFGIGEGASSALITGMAKEGGGHAQFITGTDRMQPKVMQSLRYSLQPSVKDISVTWDLPQGVSVTDLSPPITALFHGQRSLIYAQLTGESSEAAEGSVTLKYTLAGHPSQNQLHFSLKPTEDTGLTLHRLGARSLIRSLEINFKGQQNERVERKVVELSVQSGVSSSLTAFIVVNKDSSEPIKGPLLYIVDNPASCINANCGLFDISDDYSRSSKIGRTVNKKVKSVFSRIGSYLKLSRRASSERKEMSQCSAASIKPEETLKDPLLQLVSLQEAHGCWLLDPMLAAALGKTSKELENRKPSTVNQEVWATILALIWLHGFKMDMKEEWELLALKAVSWLRAQNAPCVAECVEAGNALLGCEVQKDLVGL